MRDFPLNTLYALTHRIAPSLYLKDGLKLLKFDHVFSALLLAHKYGAHDILQQGLDALKECYPDTPIDRGSPPQVPFEDIQFTHAIGAIHLARLTGTPSIIPPAMLACCELGGSIVSGWTRGDGSVLRLSEADLKRCIEGRGALATRALANNFEIIRWFPSKNCSTRASCRAGVVWAIEELAQSNSELAHIMQKLDILVQIIVSVEASTLCEKCKEDLEKFGKYRRRKLWGDLPDIFDVAVGGWAARD